MHEFLFKHSNKNLMHRLDNNVKALVPFTTDKYAFLHRCLITLKHIHE